MEDKRKAHKEVFYDLETQEPVEVIAVPNEYVTRDNVYWDNGVLKLRLPENLEFEGR